MQVATNSCNCYRLVRAGLTLWRLPLLLSLSFVLSAGPALAGAGSLWLSMINWLIFEFNDKRAVKRRPLHWVANWICDTRVVAGWRGGHRAFHFSTSATADGVMAGSFVLGPCDGLVFAQYANFCSLLLHLHLLLAFFFNTWCLIQAKLLPLIMTFL